MPPRAFIFGTTNIHCRHHILNSHKTPITPLLHFPVNLIKLCEKILLLLSFFGGERILDTNGGRRASNTHTNERELCERLQASFRRRACSLTCCSWLAPLSPLPEGFYRQAQDASCTPSRTTIHYHPDHENAISRTQTDSPPSPFSFQACEVLMLGVCVVASDSGLKSLVSEKISHLASLPVRGGVTREFDGFV